MTAGEQERGWLFSATPRGKIAAAERRCGGAGPFRAISRALTLPAHNGALIEPGKEAPLPVRLVAAVRLARAHARAPNTRADTAQGKPAVERGPDPHLEALKTDRKADVRDATLQAGSKESSSAAVASQPATQQGPCRIRLATKRSRGNAA